MKKAWLVLLCALWVFPILYVVLFSLITVIPYPALLPQNFTLSHWHGVFFSNPLFYEGLVTSFFIASLTGICTTAAGLATAQSLSGYSEKYTAFRFILISLPLFIPSMILIMGLHLVMLRLSLAYSIPAVVTSHVIISLPYSTAVFTAYLRGIGPSLREVAFSLGCNKVNYLRRILLPLLMPAMFFSFSIGFLLSFSELFSVLLLGGGQIISFSMLMYPAITNNQWGAGAVLGTLFLMIHLGLFITADHVIRNSKMTGDYFY